MTATAGITVGPACAVNNFHVGKCWSDNLTAAFGIALHLHSLVDQRTITSPHFTPYPLTTPRPHNNTSPHNTTSQHTIPSPHTTHITHTSPCPHATPIPHTTLREGYN